MTALSSSTPAQSSTTHPTPWRCAALLRSGGCRERMQRGQVRSSAKQWRLVLPTFSLNAMQGCKGVPFARCDASDALHPNPNPNPNHNLFGLRFQLDGGDVDTLVQYGSFLCDSCGDLALAEDAFRKAAEAQPAMFDAVRNLGAILEGRGADDEAKMMYRRALALSPADEDVRHSIKRMEIGCKTFLGARKQ